MSKGKDGERKKCCPHTECKRYRGKDTPCDWRGVHCEVHSPGRGLPGRYGRDECEALEQGTGKESSSNVEKESGNRQQLSILR